MLSNQKSSRFYSFKGIAFLAIALALLMNVTAFASGNSRFAFIDTAAEFFGLQSNNVAASVVSNEQQITFMAPCTANSNIPVTATLPALSQAPGPLSIPITVPDLTDCTIISYDLNLQFDSAVIRPASPAVTQGGTVSAGMIVTPNNYGCFDPGGTCTNGPGLSNLTLSAFQATPLVGGGTLVIVNFVVQNNPGSSTTLTFSDYTDPAPAFHSGLTWNENNGVTDPIPAPVNGSVSIPLGPTATSTNTDTPTPSSTSTFTPSNTATNTNTPTPTFTPSNTSTPTPTPLCAQVDIDDEIVVSGDPVVISVTTSDTTSLVPPAFSADFRVSFDNTILTGVPTSPYGVTLGPVGLSNGSSLTVNRQISGSTTTLLISVFGDTPFSGSGALVDISFPTVTGPPGTFSPINFTAFPFVPAGFWYNEGFPSSCVTSGSVQILAEVSGNVKYGNILFAPAIRPIPGTLLTAAGSPLVTDLTDVNGDYTLSGMGSGLYTVTPSRPGSALPDTHGSSISAYDAAITAQHVVELIVLNPTQKFVANVSGVQPISSFDSAFMAKWAVSLPGTAFTGDWRFSPSSRNYVAVTNLVAENYDGLLMGDVSGNWCDPTTSAVPCTLAGTVTGQPRPANGPIRATEVRASNVSVSAGSDVTIPVSVNGAADKGIISYQFDLHYDPTVIQPTANAVTLGGTVSSEMNVVFNAAAPGLLKVAVYGPYELTSNGTLLNFHFTAVGAPFSASALKWDNFIFNDGGIRFNVVEGLVEITAAVPNTAAE